MIGRRLTVYEQVQFAGLVPKCVLYRARLVSVVWPFRFRARRIGRWMLLPVGTPATGFTVAELLCDMAGVPRELFDSWVLSKMSEPC